MRRHGPLFLVGAFLLLLSWVAFGQTKKTGKAGKESAADDSAEQGAAGSAGAATESDDPGDDLGAPPPPRKETDDKVRPSPLNPKANEFPDGGARPPPPQYDQLLGDIAALRSRVAALTTTLFASKIRIIVQTDDQDSARIQKLVVTLDDGVVYNAPSRFSAEDEKIVYEHAVAPGHHVVGIEVERSDARGKQYQTWQGAKFSVVVPESKLLEAHMVVEDDSDMAEDFPDDEDGEYELNMSLRARVAE